jgi:hypothetical protein
MSLGVYNSLFKFQFSKRKYAVYFSENLQKTDGNPAVYVVVI